MIKDGVCLRGLRYSSTHRGVLDEAERELQHNRSSSMLASRDDVAVNPMGVLSGRSPEARRLPLTDCLAFSRSANRYTSPYQH